MLPRDFSALPEGGGLYDLLTRRRSARNLYGGGAQPAAAFVPALGHAGRGRAMRGRAYATLRTVPSGGARPAFDDLSPPPPCRVPAPGCISQSAMEHSAESSCIPSSGSRMLFPNALRPELGGKGQRDLLLVPFVPYRARSGATVPMPMRRCSSMAGHVGENLYLACASQASAPAACAPSAMSCCCGLFQDWTARRSFIVYAAPGRHGPPEDTGAGDGVLSISRRCRNL